MTPAVGAHRETPIWDHQQRIILVKNLHLGQIDDVLAIDQLDVVNVDISGVQGVMGTAMVASRTAAAAPNRWYQIAIP